MSSGLRLAQHLGHVLSQTGITRLGAHHTTRKVSFGFRSPTSKSFVPKGNSRRWFKAPLPEEPPSPPQSTSKALAKPSLSSKPSPSPKKDSEFVTKGDIPTPSEQRKSDWGITKRLLVNVWPKNDWKTRWTVLLGFGLLVSSKVSVPCLANILWNV